MTKRHGKKGWFLSLRRMGQEEAQAKLEQLRPLMLPVQPPMAPKQRQGTFVPLVVAAVRRSKEYEDLPLVSPSTGTAPLRIASRTSSDTVRTSETARPSRTHGRRRSGSVSSIASVFSKKRTPSVFSQGSRRSTEEDAAPLVGALEVDDPFARSPRRMSDRVEELDDAASLRSVPVNPQTRKRGGVALNTWPWRPESNASEVSIGTAV